MKRITVTAALLAGSVCLSVQAAADHHSGATLSPMQQDYQKQMDDMHDGMMAGMRERATLTAPLRPGCWPTIKARLKWRSLSLNTALTQKCAHWLKKSSKRSRQKLI